MVFAVGICATDIEQHVRVKGFDGFFNGGEKCGQVFFVGDAIFEIQIEGGMRFVGGVVVLLMNGEGEDGIVLAEDGSGAIAVVDVGVHDHGAGDFVAGLQRANGDGYIVDGAEAFAVAGICVVKAAAEVAAEAVLQGGLGGCDCAAGCQPECADEFGGIGDFQFHLIARGQCAGFELLDPVFGVDAEDIGVGCGFGAEEVARFSDAFVQEFVVDEAKFFGGKDVGAEIEVVALVVDEFEGQHECNQSQFSTEHTNTKNDITAVH